MKKLLVAFTVFMLGFVLVGCGENGNVDEFSEKGFETGGVSQEEYDNLRTGLVGTWQLRTANPLLWSRGENFLDELKFNADGTGFAETKDIEMEASYSFKWAVNGDVISLEFEDGDAEEWQYSISDDMLTVELLGIVDQQFPIISAYYRVD